MQQLGDQPRVYQCCSLQPDVPKTTLELVKHKFIKGNFTLTVQDQYRQAYLDIVPKSYEVISHNKFNLGQTETLLQDITLNHQETGQCEAIQDPSPPGWSGEALGQVVKT